MKYPREFGRPVDMTKINSTVIDRWIDEEIEKYVPGDDILADFVKNLIQITHPDIKDIHSQLTSFLENDTLSFTTKLWRLLLDAQEDEDGVPKELINLREQQLQEARKRQAKEALEAEEMERKRSSYIKKSNGGSFRDRKAASNGRKYKVSKNGPPPKRDAKFSSHNSK